MAERDVRKRQYAYTENASKIVQVSKGSHGPINTGEAESLVGKKMEGFGDRVSKEEDKEYKILKEKAKRKEEK